MNPAAFIDHTLLKPDTTVDQVRRLCEEAVEYGFAAVCVPPVHVSAVAERLYGSETAVATVVGFPLGYVETAVKVFETERAVAGGAGEIDMVIHLGDVREGRLDRIGAEVGQVVRAAEGAPVKVILECGYLENRIKTALVEEAVAGGADYVKTSTGFGPGGATAADVRLLAAASRGRVGVKAAGGIRDWESCREMLEAGAGRIGTSAGTTIMEQWRRETGR